MKKSPEKLRNGGYISEVKMIKIIKEGTRNIRECESCGCLFSFDKEDIEITHEITEIERYDKKYVKCPQCSIKVKISFENKIPRYANCSNCKYKFLSYRESPECKECGSVIGYKNWEPMENYFNTIDRNLRTEEE